MQIEIYADLTCPWSYLGKRRLEAALGRSPFARDAILRWRPYQLDPDLPRPGQPLLTWLARRHGSVERARAAMTQVRRTAAAEGIEFDVDRAIIANTFDAHRLLWFADQPEAVFSGATADTQQELVESLHRAHFTDGLDLSDREVLIALAGEAGLDEDRVRQLLRTTEATADVRAALARAHDLGISSVPTFVFAGTYTVSGAQDARTMTGLLAEVARRERLAPTVRSLVPQQRRTPAPDDDSRVG